MPKVEVVDIADVQKRGIRQDILDEYKKFIDQLQGLGNGKALQIRAEKDEKLSTIRGNLKRVADSLGKTDDIAIQMKGDAVALWKRSPDEKKKYIESRKRRVEGIRKARKARPKK